MKRNRSTAGISSRGFGVLGWLIMIAVVIIALLILVIGFYEGRKAYWDYRVREMCEKDGGVTVYEKVLISTEQYKNLPKVADSVSIPPEALMKPESPAFSTLSESVLREWQPRITRREQQIKRRLDGKVIGKIVSYSRVGGDFPTVIGHPTSFSCPEYKRLYADQAQIFSVTGESK